MKVISCLTRNKKLTAFASISVLAICGVCIVVAFIPLIICN